MTQRATDLAAGALVEWLAVDWGISGLRVTAMGAAGPLAMRASDLGAGRLRKDEFEPALLGLVSDWLPESGALPVFACGMVGSRQGWAEAQYRAVPCTPADAGAMVMVETLDKRIEVHIAPGLSQNNPADVMRGEETQIAGALALLPDFDGVFCLPGTHSKWAHVSAGEVISFQTFMTGELFALLSRRSVLRHTVAGDGWDRDAFGQGLDDALSRPDKIGARLFGLRAEALLHGLSGAAACARLSGLLTGVELAAAKPYWLGQSVTLIGSEKLLDIYSVALLKQGLATNRLSGEACTIAGLARLRNAG